MLYQWYVPWYVHEYHWYHMVPWYHDTMVWYACTNGTRVYYHGSTCYCIACIGTYHWYVHVCHIPWYQWYSSTYGRYYYAAGRLRAEVFRHPTHARGFLLVSRRRLGDPFFQRVHHTRCTTMKVKTPLVAWHGREETDGKNDSILSLDFHHTLTLATGGADNCIRIWHLKPNGLGLFDQDSGTTLGGSGNGSRAVNKGMRTRPEDCVAPSVTTTTLGFYNFAFALSGHERPVNVVRFSPNGECLASAGDDGRVVLWRRNEGTTGGTSGGGGGSGGSNGGAAAGSDAAVSSVNGCSGTSSSPPPAGSCSSASSSSSSSAAAAVASAPVAGWNWSMATAERDVQYKIFRGHLDDVYDLQWSPDGRCLISGSVDNSAIVWDVRTGKILQHIKEHSGYVQGSAPGSPSP
jgi:hypothetical protein